jgi:hypothetical protein
MRRIVEIVLKMSRAMGNEHPELKTAINNYSALLQGIGRSQEEIASILQKM